MRLIGPTGWHGSRDKDGHRDYKVTFLCEGPSTEGPASALACEGLPVPGDEFFLLDDFDEWATCRQDATMTPIFTGEPNDFWHVEVTFSTKPDLKRCKDQQIEDPLLVPPRVSGSTNTYQEEAKLDKNNVYIVNSAWEAFHGPQVEFDKNRSTVKIEMNVPSLDILGINDMVDTVNDGPMWGMPNRCVKLGKFGWEAKFYGRCFEYYTIILEFEIRRQYTAPVTPDGGGPNVDTLIGGFDRVLQDQGTKVLNGHWGRPDLGQTEGIWYLDNIGGSSPNPQNPSHFIRYRDLQSGNVTSVILDGSGAPVDQVITEPGAILVEYYPESNFFSLGIPVTL